MNARLRGRMARSAGKVGESLTKAALLSSGFVFVERVHTPWKVVRKLDPKTQKSRIVGAVPEEKVSGDFRAVDSSGRSVLVEAKFDGGDRVLWSDLEEHQVAALNAHHEARGRSILSVVIGGEAFLLEWPIPGFGPGHSIRRTGNGVILK